MLYTKLYYVIHRWVVSPFGLHDLHGCPALILYKGTNPMNPTMTILMASILGIMLSKGGLVLGKHDIVWVLLASMQHIQCYSYGYKPSCFPTYFWWLCGFAQMASGWIAPPWIPSAPLAQQLSLNTSITVQDFNKQQLLACRVCNTFNCRWSSG